MIVFINLRFAMNKITSTSCRKPFVEYVWKQSKPKLQFHFRPKAAKTFPKGESQTQGRSRPIRFLPAFVLPGLVAVKCGSKMSINEEDLPLVITGDHNKPFDWCEFMHFLTPELWRLIVAVLAAVAAAFINVQLPINLGKVIDVLSEIAHDPGTADTLAKLKEPVLKLLSVYFMQSFFTFLYVDFISTVGENLAKNLKNAIFVKVLQQDLSFFDYHRSGEIIDCLTTDVQEFKSSFKQCISQGLRSSTQILGCLLSLMSISPEMTGAVFLILPTVILIGSVIGSKLRDTSKEAQKQAAWCTILAEEIISNMRTVRSFGMEQSELEKMEKELEKTSQLYKKLGFGIALFQAGTNMFLNSIVLSTLAMGGYMLSLKKLSTGNVMSFLVAMQTIQKSLAQLSLLFGHYIKGIASGARVLQYIKMLPKVPLEIDSRRTIPLSLLNANITFENVTFSYPTRPDQTILKNFSLEIPSGKVAAIVGTSGNGKSTAAALLLKLYEANEGAVKIGGMNINNLDETWLRRRVIGFINQEPVLFATTIKENIRYGNPDATDQEVYEAAKLANADEFIRAFPDGYNTLAGEKGTAISGGQKQRIAIARAFLKKPMILVLDEATSALDTISEQKVQKSLEAVMKNRTVLIIAHRLSTIKSADVIVVLDNGLIVEVGKHDELINRHGYYWNLMNQQEQHQQTPKTLTTFENYTL